MSRIGDSANARHRDRRYRRSRIRCSGRSGPVSPPCRNDAAANLQKGKPAPGQKKQQADTRRLNREESRSIRCLRMSGWTGGFPNEFNYAPSGAAHRLLSKVHSCPASQPKDFLVGRRRAAARGPHQRRHHTSRLVNENLHNGGRQHLLIGPLQRLSVRKFETPVGSPRPWSPPQPNRCVLLRALPSPDAGQVQRRDVR